MSEFVPTPSERIAVALEQLSSNISDAVTMLVDITDALTAICERQDATLRLEYEQLKERTDSAKYLYREVDHRVAMAPHSDANEQELTRYKAAMHEAAASLRAFTATHEQAIDRWERKAAQTGGAS